MPMHDWTRVEPNDYHDFHLAWIAALRLAFNSGVLPEGYFAQAEHTIPPFVPDVLTMTLAAQDGFGASGDTGTAVAAPVTHVAATESRKKGGKRAGRRRVAVRHVQNRRLVAVIEIVSPGNKASQREFADLRDKSIELLDAGVHLLLIDPLPPTARDPEGCTTRCGGR